MQICLLEQSGNPVINGVEAERRSHFRGPAYGGVDPAKEKESQFLMGTLLMSKREI
jgi:hypothetical protein